MLSNLVYPKIEKVNSVFDGRFKYHAVKLWKLRQMYACIFSFPIY